MLRCVIDLNMFQPHLIRRAERAHQEALWTDVDDRCYDCTVYISLISIYGVRRLEIFLCISSQEDG